MIENDVKQIIEHFGFDSQLLKLQEEQLELVEAIKSFKRTDVIGEIADCRILLDQFQEYFNITNGELNDMMIHKFERTLDRIESGYYEVV